LDAERAGTKLFFGNTKSPSALILAAIVLFAPQTAMAATCWIDHVTVSPKYARIYFVNNGSWVINAHVFHGSEKYKNDSFGVHAGLVEGQAYKKDYLEIGRDDRVDLSMMHSGCSLTVEADGVRVDATDSLPGLPPQKVSVLIPASVTPDDH
jgi:hypothetical protein